MARNAVRMTNYYIEETFDDGEKFIVFFDTEEEMFYEAAHFYAFDDDLDTGMRITKIVCEGDTCHYLGWQPDMVIEFVWDESGETAWSGQFPEWDH